MALDFFIDDRGELSFSTPRRYDRLRIDWYDSDYPTLRIDFEQSQEYPLRIPKNKRLRIDFFTVKGDEINNRRINTVNDKYEIMQRTMIRLRTELGEIPIKQDFGSTLVRQRHKDILSEEVQQNIKSIVEADIADILENPIVVVKPVKTSGPFFCQNIRVVIYDGDTLIYSLLV